MANPEEQSTVQAERVNYAALKEHDPKSAQQMTDLVNALDSGPDHLASPITLLGYKFDRERSEVEFPTLDQLNQAKTALPESIGVNSGVFVEASGEEEIIPAAEYVGYFAKGQIPMTPGRVDESFLAMHDRAKHAVGFGLMHADMFGFIVKKAQEAVESGKPEDLEAVTAFADGASVILAENLPYPEERYDRNSPLKTDRLTNQLAREYQAILDPRLAGVKATHDVQKQQQLVAGLLNVVEARQAA